MNAQKAKMKGNESKKKPKRKEMKAQKESQKVKMKGNESPKRPKCKEMKA